MLGILSWSSKKYEDMKDPKKLCKEHNLTSYQAYKAAELMAETIKRDVAAILTTPSDRKIYEQLKEYFTL
jgi:hypothetical protein